MSNNKELKVTEALYEVCDMLNRLASEYCETKQIDMIYECVKDSHMLCRLATKYKKDAS